MRWSLALQSHDVVFVKREKNAAADCLSRMVLDGEPDQVLSQE